jgi:RNA polymerase sigma factor (TIGR02999 family)
MADVTQILAAIDAGDKHAAEQLFPLVYDELRKLAAAKLVEEKPGQTLQPTALVHEAWLRLNVASCEENSAPPSGVERGDANDRRRYFFAAAGEAMRRILIDQARRKKAEIHGGQARRVELNPELCIATERSDYLLAVNEALDRLSEHDAPVAELVKLRYFVGMTIHEVAQALNISPRTADAWWAYARAWLREALDEEK